MKTHQCDFRDIPLRDAKEIILDHITDLGKNRNDDHVLHGWGVDGVFYRLVECKHNPPHSTKRKITEEDTKQGLDNASMVLGLWNLLSHGCTRVSHA